MHTTWCQLYGDDDAEKKNIMRPFSRFNGCVGCLQQGVSLAALIERGSISMSQRRWQKYISQVNQMIGSAALDMARKIHRRQISTIVVSRHFTEALKREDDYELV